MSEKRESMTAEKRANNLWEDCKGASKANAYPFIVEAIKEAEAQARAEMIDRHGNLAIDTLMQAHNEAYEKGWRECREAANQLTDTQRATHYFRADPYEQGLWDMAKLLSEAISSLQPPSEAGR